MISCLKGQRHDEDEDHEDNYHSFFIRNGGVLLKELVAFSNGRPNPIRHFSAKELLIATNYYDPHQIVVQDYSHYQLYKGYLKDIPVFVKKYESPWGFSGADPYKDIAIGSQMSAHKNVLKVLGCCLETEKPTIVYEHAGTRTLSACISSNSVEQLPWKCRLKIAVDIANAIAYLHTAFHRPVIHRDIYCSNIILDENNVPKLIDFGLCIPIPEGQIHVRSTIVGKMMWWPSEYILGSNVKEKLDVYCFGRLLVDLFTGNKAIDEIMEFGRLKHRIRNINNVVDSRITQEGIEAQQLLDFVILICKCLHKNEEKRPTMMDVAKQLRRIHQSY